MFSQWVSGISDREDKIYNLSEFTLGGSTNKAANLGACMVYCQETFACTSIQLTQLEPH